MRVFSYLTYCRTPNNGLQRIATIGSIFCIALGWARVLGYSGDFDLYYFRNFPAAGWNWTAGAIAGIVSGYIHWDQFRRNQTDRPCVKWIAYAVLPGLFVSGFPGLFWLLCILGAVVGQTFSLFPPLRMPRLAAFCGIAALCGIVTGWYIFLQWKSWATFYSLYMDWAFYFEQYAFGSPTWHNLLITGGHWNWVPNIVCYPLCHLLPSIWTIWSIHALLLGSGIPLTYLLAREYRLERNAAWYIAIVYALNPVGSLLALSLFYGYHPIIWQIPVLMLFFLFQHRNNRCGMTVTFLLSLGIQETAAIFWFGYGFWLFLSSFGNGKINLNFGKKRLFGLSLMLGCSCFFLAVSQFLMPAISGTSCYSQLFHYNKFGNSFSEILLSPVQRGELFWGTLANWRNVQLLLFFLIPGCWLWRYRPGLLLAALPLSLAAFLKGSLEVQSPHCWYHLELLPLWIICVIQGAAVLHPGRNQLGECRAAAWMCCVLFFLFGACPYGKNSQMRLLERHDYRNLSNQFKQQIPAGSTIRTTPRLRTHFLEGYRTLDLQQNIETDYVLLDWNDSALPESELDTSLIQLGPEYVPEMVLRQARAYCVLFKRNGNAVMPFIKKIDAAAFVQQGIAIQQPEDAFDIRMNVLKEGLLISFRILKRTDRDFRLEFFAKSADGRSIYKNQRFGYGAYPVYRMNVGDVFQWYVKLPPDFKLNQGNLNLPIRYSHSACSPSYP